MPDSVATDFIKNAPDTVFARSLWVALGQPGIGDLEVPAQKLKTTKRKLVELFVRNRPITVKSAQKLLRRFQKAYRPDLATMGELEMGIQALTPPPPPLIAPKDLKDIRFTLFLALGGNTTDLITASQILKIDPPNLLTAIFKGRRPIDLKVMQEQWIPRLMQYRPHDWEAHGATLQSRLNQLTRSGGRKIDLPQAPESLGYHLLKILGWPEIEPRKIAKDLKVTVPRLRKILSNDDSSMTQAFWGRKRRLDILRDKYETGWEKYGTDFLESLYRLPEDKRQKPPKTQSQKWAKAASEILSQTLLEKGDDRDVILAASPNLSPKALEKVMTASRLTPLVYFTEALRALLTTYGYRPDQRPETAAPFAETAYRLLETAPPHRPFDKLKARSSQKKIISI
jgi:hypothetical protein